MGAAFHCGPRPARRHGEEKANGGATFVSIGKKERSRVKFRERRKRPIMSEPTTNPADPAATDATSENARDGVKKTRQPNEPAAVVGLGASAGGIAPLQQFFGEMPPDSGLAFVVVMHLSPEHESSLAAVLQQKTQHAGDAGDRSGKGPGEPRLRHSA